MQELWRFGRNPCPSREDEGSSEGWGLRGKLEWDLSERLNLLASAEYRVSDVDCCQYGLVSVQSPTRAAIYAAAGVPITEDTGLTWNSGSSYANSEQKTFSLEAGYDLDRVRLVSITAFQDFSIDTNFEPDRLGSSVPIYLSTTSNALYDFNFAGTQTRQFSQELRLDSLRRWQGLRSGFRKSASFWITWAGLM